MSDIEGELDSLAGENLALQSIILGLCLGLQRADLGQAVEHAFAYADHVLEAGAIQVGASARLAHMQKALSVAEALRIATLGSHGEPQQGI